MAALRRADCSPEAVGAVEGCVVITPAFCACCATANTLDVHRVMFAVDDIEDVLARIRPHGAELVGEVTRFEDSYLLCYLRGPSGIILGLAEQRS